MPDPTIEEVLTPKPEARLRIYAPDGRLLRKVRFPVSNVTKIAFGGHDLKTVYVTTAAKGLSADELRQQPLAGGLFRFEVDIPGQPQYEIEHV